MKNQKFRARKGATFIEYALLAGLVAIVVAAAAMFFGQDIKNLFGATGAKTEEVATGVSNVDLTSGLNATGEAGNANGGTSGN